MSNRYTNITPSAYSPMSLNEIMLAPSLQRKQHDATNAKIQEYLASLSSIDPHDKHWDVAQAEKERLVQELDRNASQLAQKGFSPDITDNIMKFNRDYQSSVSPTGKLGQIQAEHANIKAQEDNFRKNYIAMGYSPDQVERKLQESMEEYRRKPIFDNRGKITSYSPTPMAKYVNHIDEADKYFSKAQISADDWARISSGLQMTPDGRFEYVGTTTTERNWANNNKQLEAALGFLNRRLGNPNDELHRSLIDQGKTPIEALEDINAMMGIYQKESTGRKDGFQMSNLMSTNAGNDQQEPVKGVYVTNTGTYSFTEDFETLSSNTSKTLEDPQASPVDKSKARDTQKLIQDIENELSDPESPHYDEEYIDLEQNVQKIFSQLHPGSTKLLKTMINHGIFDPVEHQRTKDENGTSWSKVTFNTPDGLLNVDIPTKEFKELNTHYLNIGKVYSKLNDKRNERLNQHAHEELRYVAPTEKTSERTIEAIDFFRSTTINNIIPQHINVTDGNIPKIVEFNDEEKLKLATVIRRASNDEIKSILPTEVGRQAGFNVEVAFNKNNESAKELSLNGELVNIFIPINTSTEPLTGHEASAMMNLSSLPESFQNDFKKIIDTQHISSTRDYEDLGQNSVPGESILGKTFEGGGEIDFLENKSKNPNENYVSMYGKTKDGTKFKPMTWESIIRYDLLTEDSENAENYARIIASSGIKEVLKKTAKKYESYNNKTLFEVFNLGSENADWKGFIKELRHREIRLSHTRDVYEISRLKAREQYE